MDIKGQLTAALVIEQHSLTQNHIKYCLQKIGFDKVDMVDRANKAIKSLQTNYYDLVLCASELQDGADGFQLFEQILDEKLLFNTASFIYISAEQDVQLSQGVIELNPDDFLLKPFNSMEFETRVSKTLNKKIKFKSILQELDKQNYRDAIIKLNKAIAENVDPTYTPYLMKLKGEIITIIKSWAVGERFFKNVCYIHPYKWAKIGYVECLIHLGKHNVAKPILLEMAKPAQTRLAALDLMVKIELQHKEFEQALQHLKQATNISPRNVYRLKELANIARVTHDYESQYEANIGIVRQIPNSIHENANAYLAAARSAVDFGIMSMEDEQVERMTQSSQTILGSLKKAFPHEYLTDQIDVTKARIYNLKNNPKKAKQLIQASVEKIENRHVSVTPDNIEANLDVAKALHELGFYKHSQVVFKQLADLGLTGQDGELFNQYIQEEQQTRLELRMSPKELNNKAVNCFKMGNLEDALNSFELAFKVMPKNPTIALNLMQTAVETNRHLDQVKVDYIVNRCIKSINNLKLTPEQSTRYNRLNEIMLSQTV